MAAAKRILVVEDNLTTAKTLTLFLESAGYEVDCVHDGSMVMNEFLAKPFDLILLDIMLPGLDGLSICRKIRETSLTPIVILTAKTSEDDIVNGLEMGANDYVCKPFGSKELLARIRSCLRIWQCDTEASDLNSDLTLGDIRLDIENRRVFVGSELTKLTKSEFAILKTMIAQPGRVFTREQLIEHALGNDYEGVDRTIDTHIWSLRKKLKEPKGNPRYLHSEMGIGYRLQDLSLEASQ